MGKKSIQKGSSFERKVAKELSLWYSKKKDAFIFERRAGSGGSKRDQTGDSGESGDIFSVKTEGKKFLKDINIELKHYKDLKPSLWNIMAGDPDKIMRDFLMQATASKKKYFLLIIKSNNFPALCISNFNFFKGNDFVFTNKHFFFFPYRLFLN